MLQRSLIFHLLVSAALGATSLAVADTKSRIEAVTVYPGGALVTRVASVDLSRGDNEIRLTGLVNELDSNSLQLAVSDASVRIGQLKVSTEQARQTAQARIAELQAQIGAKKREIQAVNDSTKAADLRLKFLDGLSQGYTGNTVNGGSALPVSELRQVLSLLQSEGEAASELKRANAAKLEPLNKDLSLLERQLAQLRGGGLSSKSVSVTLTAGAPLSATVRLTYYQYNAAWRPVYEARMDSDTGRLQLLQKAAVSQGTEESWDDVSLTLSTSEPNLNMDAPAVTPEFVDLRDPVVPMARGLKSRSLAGAPLVQADQMAEVVVTGARRVASNFAVNYAIPGRTSVPNAVDEETSLDIEGFEFDTTLVTLVVPRQSTDAFLQARFTYDEDVPLMSSDMRVFVDNVYTGDTRLPEILPNTQVELPMGLDRRVEVLSKSQGGETSVGGLISKRKQETTDYLFEVTNSRSQPTEVEIRDRVPVSRNKDIEVEILNRATPASESDVRNQPGLLVWRRTLEADETWTVRHAYTVSYPSDKVLAY